jgi:hypothetical protein
MPPSNGGDGANNNGQAQVKYNSARGSGRCQQKLSPEGNKDPVVKQPKFVGQCEDLNGHIFDCEDLNGHIFYCSSAQGANVFTKSKQELAEYAGRSCKRSAEVRITIENLESATIPRPDDPAENASQWDQQIWDKMINACIKARVQLE